MSFSKNLTFILLLMSLHLTILYSFQLKRSKGSRNEIFKNNNWYQSSSNRVNIIKMIGMDSIASVAPTLASLSAISFVTAFHEAGHFLAARSQGILVESYNVGYGPKLISFNDTNQIEYNFRLLPLGGYVSFPSNIKEDEKTGQISEIIDENPDLLQNRNTWQRAIVICGGVFANIFLSFLIFTYIATNSGIAHPVYGDGIVVNSRVESSPGMKAGVQIKDVITKVNGRSIFCTNSNCVPEFVKTIQNTPDGQIVKLEIQRPTQDSPTISMPVFGTSSDVTSDGTTNNKNMKKSVSTSLSTIQLSVSPTRNGNPGGKSMIGIGVSPNIKSNTITKASSPLDAINMGAQETYTQLKSISTGLVTAVSNGFQGSEVGGPISVIKVGATVAQYDPVAILGFMSFLSLNLAILNSLPLPALDGGQLVFVLIEELRGGKKLPREVQISLVALAFSFLLVVSSATLVNDLSHINDPSPTPMTTNMPKRN